MDNSNKHIADEEQGENHHHHHQQQQQQQSSRKFKAPEERPYRRRIKPPVDKVHHVHPARFRRFVQRRTCHGLMPPLPGSSSDHATVSATSSSSATSTTRLLQPPAAANAAIIGDGDPATPDASTRESMQAAYVAWCSSNDLPLSPGTMAELPFTERHAFSNDQR